MSNSARRARRRPGTAPILGVPTEQQAERLADDMLLEFKRLQDRYVRKLRDVTRWMSTDERTQVLLSVADAYDTIARDIRTATASSPKVTGHSDPQP